MNGLTIRSVVLLLVCLIVGPWGACSAQELGEAAEREDAIERGLAFVAVAGDKWIAKRQCVTCHQIPSLIWSHRVAAGYEARSSGQLAKWEVWSTDVVSFVKPERKKDVDFATALEANVDTAAQLLLAIPRPSGGEGIGWRGAFAKRLAELQAEDGSWRACGQLPLQKRPVKETHAVTTLWTSLALIQEGTEFNQAAALDFATIKNPESIEWFAARLLVGNSRASTNADRIKSLQEQIVAHQNADGGWGWRNGEASDALGTGYALYALKTTGMGSDLQPVRDAIEYLVQTQRSDGSWQTPGTKRNAKGRVTPTATDWGSAWAVISLAAEQQTLSE